jgi:hypothetical protein
MAIAVKLLANIFTPGSDTTQSTQIIRGQLTFSGSYVSGGDTVNFSSHAVGVAGLTSTNQRPIQVNFWEEPASGTAVAGVSPLMYYRNVSAKPTAANGVIQVVSSATISGGTLTAGVELSAATYPTAISGAVVYFEAVFVLGR